MRARWSRVLPAAVLLCLTLAANSSELQWQRHAAGMDAAAADGGYAGAELRFAWSSMMDDLHAARAMLESPQFFPAPYGDRNLAEGYRYLLGQMHRLLEVEAMQNTAHPYLMRFPSNFTRYGLDNADALYLYAPIEPNSTYLLIGRADKAGHWRGRWTPRRGDLAPRHVRFALQTELVGATAEPAALVTAAVTSPDIKLSSDGSFEIMISPEPPAGYEGNHLQSIVVDEDGQRREARHLLIRQLFLDWARERSLYLEIVRVGKAGAAGDDVVATDVGTALRNAGRGVREQLQFWGARLAAAQDAMPENCLGESMDIEEAGADQRGLLAGRWSLDAEQSLLIEVKLPAKPVYSSIQLNDRWGRSLDYANRLGSLNQQQAAADKDGWRRYVISHTDPGVANWLDTGGQRSGYVLQSQLYRELNAGAAEVKCQLLATDELEAALPEGMRRVDPLTRRKQILARQQHVARRYRQY